MNVANAIIMKMAAPIETLSIRVRRSRGLSTRGFSTGMAKQTSAEHRAEPQPVRGGDRRACRAETIQANQSGERPFFRNRRRALVVGSRRGAPVVRTGRSLLAFRSRRGFLAFRSRPGFLALVKQRQLDRLGVEHVVGGPNRDNGHARRPAHAIEDARFIWRRRARPTIANLGHAGQLEP